MSADPAIEVARAVIAENEAADLEMLRVLAQKQILMVSEDERRRALGRGWIESIEWPCPLTAAGLSFLAGRPLPDLPDMRPSAPAESRRVAPRSRAPKPKAKPGRKRRKP